MHIVNDVINKDIIPLSANDTIKRALEVMENYDLTNYPVVHNDNFIGVVAKHKINNIRKNKKLLFHLKEAIDVYCVAPYVHITEAMAIINNHKTDIVPVVEENTRKYLGVILLRDIFTLICEMDMIRDAGSIIVIETTVRDYYLSQIAKIIEDCDAKITGLFFNSHPDTTKVFLTIKINTIESSRIIASLKRFNINVISFYASDPNVNSIQKNYEYLMSFLNI